MAKVLLYFNASEPSIKLKEDFIHKSAQRNIQLVSAGEAPDFLITIGGDGTFLHGFHRYYDRLPDVKFIGIHTGHLGFYTDWMRSDIDEVLDHIEQGNTNSVTYPLLEILLTYNDGHSESFLALNEFSIRSSTGMMVCDVSISGHFFEKFSGDGLCISTPTGSTGLNKSLGGAVIHPNIDAIQMTEMASVNNRVYRTLGSPIIISSQEWIELVPQNKLLTDVTIDNIYWQNIGLASVQARVSSQKINVVQFNPIHFWDRVENSFINAKRDAYDSNQ